MCLIAAAIAAGGIVYVGAGLSDLKDSVTLQARSAAMQVKVTTWYSKINGVCVLQSVSTPKGTMTDAEWQAAHRVAVADMMADYPPAADCPTPH